MTFTLAGFTIVKRGVESEQEQVMVARVAAAVVRADGALELHHDHGADGRGLDESRARRVLGYLQTIWRRPIRWRRARSTRRCSGRSRESWANS